MRTSLNDTLPNLKATAAEKASPHAPDRSGSPAPDGLCNATILVIERRALIRDCLVRCLSAATAHSVQAFASVDDWIAASVITTPTLVILCCSDRDEEDQACRDVARISDRCSHVPTILLSDADDLDRIFVALEQGVRGYIPTNLSLDVAIEALRLVNAGGVYVPADSFIAARRSPAPQLPPAPSPKKGIFTDRQAAIVDALRRGKANKVIAYELNMRESTVKVHVRNIMKKLNAKNRTEVAFITNQLVNATS